jgi:hypothetical protein
MRPSVISLMLKHMMLIYLSAYSVNNSGYIVLNDLMIGILNWKVCERKWLWPNLSYYPGISQEFG